MTFYFVNHMLLIEYIAIISIVNLTEDDYLAALNVKLDFLKLLFEKTIIFCKKLYIFHYMLARFFYFKLTLLQNNSFSKETIVFLCLLWIR